MAKNSHAPVNLDTAFQSFSDHWSPRIIANVGNMEVRACKLKGEFIWHSHEEADEMFLVRKGQLTLCLRDGDILLNPGDIYVVPRGVEHKPLCDEECEVLVMVQNETSTTGAEINELTNKGVALNLD